MKNPTGNIIRSWGRGWRLLLVFGVLVGMLAAGAGNAQSATGKDELVLIEGPEVEGLDPPRAGSGHTRHMLEALFVPLLRFDTDFKLGPGIATSWKMEGKVWTFKIRRGVKFSNGNPVTAHSAKYTIDRILDPKTKARRRSVFKIIQKIEVVDNYTLKITTKKPFADLKLLVAIPESSIIDPAAVKRYGKRFAQNPVGAGAFKLKEWVPGDKLVIVPNPTYFGPKPRFKRVVMRAVPEGSARVFALLRGEADIVAKIPTEEVERLAKDKNIRLILHPTQQSINYEINHTKKPFNDRRVRLAILYAIDRKAIVKRILLGHGVVATAVAGPGLPGRATFSSFPYNPAKARKLLAEAGYPNGFKMEVQTPNGRYVKDRLISEAVQGYLQAVGIQAKLHSYEWPRYIAHLRSDPRKGFKDMYMVGRTSPYLDYHLTRLYHSKNIKGGSSRTGYNNPEVDKLIGAARFETDLVKRKAMYDKVQRIIWDNLAFIWMHNQVIVTGVRSNVKNVKMQKGTEAIFFREAYK